MKGWIKPEPADVEHFQELAARVEGVELRKMFGYPAAFAGGNMAFGLYQDRLMLRLPESECETLLADGWEQFEPMKGRPMREYLTLPSEFAADLEQARLWLQRAADYTRSLPAKPAKRAKAAKKAR